MSDDKKVIFSMVKVSKTFPPQKQVLMDIYLSFFYGAKIGIIGLNGSGKSTLLKIAAGLVLSDSGERFVQPGLTVRYLPQEPDLTGFTTTLDYVAAGLGPGDDSYRALYLLEQLGLSGQENPANLFTKFRLSRGRLIVLLELHGCRYRDGRAESAPATLLGDSAKPRIA